MQSPGELDPRSLRGGQRTQVATPLAERVRGNPVPMPTDEIAPALATRYQSDVSIDRVHRGGAVIFSASLTVPATGRCRRCVGQWWGT